MFIDTHCHLSYDDYDDISSVIQESQEKGVSKIIISGYDKNSILESIEISRKYDCVFLTLGFHPSEALVVGEDDLEELERLLLETPKVVGIGEIGLDYHYGKEDRDLQIRLFEAQLKLAEKFNLPVVIHSRDAVSDTISILEKYFVRGVIHCFSGSLEVATRYINMGFFLGIGGVVTFKNSKLYQVVSQIGLDFLVLETDSPYLTPHPYRGYVNSSKYIPIIASKIAEVCGTSLEEVAVSTTKNATSLFDLR